MASDKFVMSSRQAAELDFAFERNGWTASDVKKLSVGDMLAQFLPVLRGNGEVRLMRHVIDCDSSPFCPDGLSVREEDQLPNRVRGQLEIDPTKIQLYLSPSQTAGSYIGGNELRHELASKPVFPANVLDYWFANPHLIPEELKVDAEGRTRYIFFWGTIYRGSGGGLCVRCLCFVGGKWGGFCGWLDGSWGGLGPAACLAS